MTGFKNSCTVVIGVAAAYIGAVVGGAFATGREILHFFMISPAEPAILALMLPGFALAGSVLMWVVVVHRATSVRDVLSLAGGKKTTVVVDLLLSGFYLAVLSVVMSAAGALGSYLWGLPRLAGILFLAVATDVVLRFRSRGISAINTALMVILAATLLATSAQLPLLPVTADHQMLSSGAAKHLPWASFQQAIIYVSYNLLFAAAVFPSWAKLGNPTACVSGAAAGGLVLGMLCWAEWRLMFEVYRHVIFADMPVYVALRLIAPAVGQWYPVVLTAALLTTAVALCLGLVSRLSGQRVINRVLFRRVVLIVAIPLASVDLKALVSILYPFAGALALLLWITIARNAWRTSPDGA